MYMPITLFGFDFKIFLVSNIKSPLKFSDSTALQEFGIPGTTSNSALGMLILSSTCPLES